MNNLNMPGFTADAVFYNTSGNYRLAAREANTGQPVVIPQLWKWLRCAAAVTGAAVVCSSAVTGVGIAACAAATVGAAAVCD